MSKRKEFQEEVIRALEKRGLTEVRHVGRARARRCEAEGCPSSGTGMEKFRAVKVELGKKRLAVAAYACRSCRHVTTWALARMEPITMYELGPVPELRGRIFHDL